MPGPDFQGQGDVLADKVRIGTTSTGVISLHVRRVGAGELTLLMLSADNGNVSNSVGDASVLWMDTYNGGAYGVQLKSITTVGNGAYPNNDFKISIHSDTPSPAWYDRFIIKNNGNVGIGTPTPSERLEVNGNVKAAGKGSFGGPAGSQGAINVPAAGVYSYNTPQRYIALRSDGTGNDLESVGAVLYINFSGQPVDFLNGKVRIEAGGNLTVRGNRFYAPNIPPGDRYWFLVNGQAEPANAVLGLYSNADGTDKRVEIKGDVYVGARKSIDSQGRCLYG